MPKLEVISSCLVQSASSSIAFSRLELTPWDLQLLLVDPIQKGLLFHKPESQQLQETIIDHLKNSFSRTLDFFPPLAGRLGTVAHDDNTTCFFVDCNNAGAEFTHAVASDVSISDILEAKYIPEIINSFFPLNGIPNIEGISKPLLGVQVNELVDGLFIGCTVNHAVVDGTSFWHFFNSWSDISRGFNKISKTPVFERDFSPNFNFPIHLLPFEKNLLPNNPILLERVFHFSKESMDKLKTDANSEFGCNKISSLQALLAHLWRSVVRCRRKCSQIENIHDEVLISLPVGARARIPLPEGYFGNAVVVGRIGVIEADLLQNGLGFVGLKINEFITKHNSEAAIKFLENWVKNPLLFRKGRSNFVVSSSPRYNVYGNDFGWGKPIAVGSGKGQKMDGKITLFPAAVYGGVDVEVCLAPETLHALEDDAEFMEAVTVSEQFRNKAQTYKPPKCSAEYVRLAQVFRSKFQ